MLAANSLASPPPIHPNEKRATCRRRKGDMEPNIRPSEACQWRRHEDEGDQRQVSRFGTVHGEKVGCHSQGHGAGKDLCARSVIAKP